jgi:hypothetical protein
MFLASELESTLEAWRFSYRILVPKLKQLDHIIINNRGSQPYIDVKLSTLCKVLDY